MPMPATSPAARSRAGSIAVDTDGAHVRLSAVRTLGGYRRPENWSGCSKPCGERPRHGVRGSPSRRHPPVWPLSASQRRARPRQHAGGRDLPGATERRVLNRWGSESPGSAALRRSGVNFLHALPARRQTMPFDETSRQPGRRPSRNVLGGVARYLLDQADDRLLPQWLLRHERRRMSAATPSASS